MTFAFTAELWSTGVGRPGSLSLCLAGNPMRSPTWFPWRPGFGSVRVEVTIGETAWSTSLFPSKELGAYVLPIKRAVREREGISVGDTIAVAISVADDHRGSPLSTCRARSPGGPVG